MQTPDDKKPAKAPSKALLSKKKIFMIFLGITIFIIVLLLSASLFYATRLYQKEKDVNFDLNNEISALDNEISALEKTQSSETKSLQKQITTLEENAEQDAKDINWLKSTKKTYQRKAEKIKKCNAVLAALIDTVDRHNGFSGWTEADYNIGRNLAVATGDQGLIDAVYNAWYDLDGDPVVRVMNVLEEIEEGISANLDS